jgi:peroxiredoxin
MWKKIIGILLPVTSCPGAFSFQCSRNHMVEYVDVNIHTVVTTLHSHLLHFLQKLSINHNFVNRNFHFSVHEGIVVEFIAAKYACYVTRTHKKNVITLV